MNTKPEFFPIQSLTFDPELQIRVKVNEETIALYAEQMATEDDMKVFPAVEIYYDGVKYWLADGHHRRAAAEMAGHDKVWAIIKSGTRADALWGAILGNGKQGVALTRADKQRAIMLVIVQQPDRSNRSIADAVGCGKSTVDRIRDQVSQMGHLNSDKKNEARTIGKDGKSYPAKQTPKTNSSAKPATVESLQPQKNTVSDLETKAIESATTPVTEPSTDGTCPEPPCPNKDVQYFPKTTLKLIPQESPHVLLVNLFEIFRKGFVEEMVVMAMDMLAEERGKDVVKTLLAKLNKTHGKK